MDMTALDDVYSRASISTDTADRSDVLGCAESRLYQGALLYVVATTVLLLLLAAEAASGQTRLSPHLPRPATLVFVVLLGGTGAMAIVFVCIRQVLQCHAAIAHLAQQIELLSRTDPGRQAVIACPGPPVLQGLIRAINDWRRNSAECASEMLTMQASYAHDLRTPLTRLLLRSDNVEDDLLRAAIERDIGEIRELAEAGLACARMQSGIQEPLRSTNADIILASLVQNYHEAGCVLGLDGKVGHPVFTCPHAFRRILGNLVENAFRYGDNVKLLVRSDSRSVHFAVVDSGPGIAPAELEAVFRPWYRSKATAEMKPGTGLGLAIARRLSLAIQGNLTLRNRNEGGLEARLSIPLGSTA